MDALLYPLALIVTLGILVTVHEWGHFWVARRAGVKVLRFSVGFGKPFWRRYDRHGTEFVLAMIPLGGYVKMLDEREAAVSPEQQRYAFNRQPLKWRVAIVAAGPIANLLFAIAAFWLMFSLGVPGMKPLIGEPIAGSPAASAGLPSGALITQVDNEPIQTMQQLTMAVLKAQLNRETVQVTTQSQGQYPVDLSTTGEPHPPTTPLQLAGITPYPMPVVLGQIQPNSAASAAQLKTGDLIISANGQAIANWQQFTAVIQSHPGRLVALGIMRDGNPENLTVRPQSHRANGETIGQLGVGAEYPPDYRQKVMTTVHYGLLPALWHAGEQTWQLSTFMLNTFWKMITLQISLKNLGGPITIAQSAGNAARVGWMPFINLLALVSISLAILNLLPIPLLDGGHLLYYLIEALRGQPVSESTQEFGNRIGLVLLGGLMFTALFNDVLRFWTALP